MRRLRLDPRAADLNHRTTVLVCGSRRQAARASASPKVRRSVLAFEQSGTLYFIAYTRDEWAGEVKATIRHELTHAFASEFGEGEHYVGLLAEGLAVAVEGDEDARSCSAELGRGHLTLPLMEALTEEDIWEGRTDREVTLAYQEGGTLVRYVKSAVGLRPARGVRPSGRRLRYDACRHPPRLCRDPRGPVERSPRCVAAFRSGATLRSALHSRMSRSRRWPAGLPPPRSSS